MKKISIIVPCYNEEDCLPLFDKEIDFVISNMPDYCFEMLYIDDGSKDKTLEIIKSLQQSDRKNVRFLSFSRNFGKEAAMYAGFVNASGEYVAVMDADLQDPPEMILDMTDILENGEYDCVATRRATRKGEPLVRSLFAKAFYKIINRISDAEIVDGARDFRMMRRNMIDAILKMTERCRFSKGIFGWIGFKTYWISYDNAERAAGKTKWSFWKLFKYSIDGIVNYSQSLLSFSSLVGIIILLLSFISLALIIIRKLIWGDPVQGWASTVSIILFIGGIQLLCISILGMYLGRVYTEVKERPVYIAAEASDEKIKKVM